MSLQPVGQEQVQATAQQMLSFLSDENVSIPGNMIEAIFSGKSLLSAIIAGNLIVCRHAEDASKSKPEGKPEDSEDPAAPKDTG